MTQRQTYANRAFTIIELLVVISIIVILASMLLAGIAMARKMALKAKTSALIGNIDSGIVKYHDINGFYPLDGDPLTTGAKKLSECTTPAIMTVNSGLLWTALRSGNYVPDANSAGNSLNDAYGFPLRYFHFLLYDGEAPRPDTYRLWSCGPDGEDQSAATPTAVCDDIRNW
jgi:prepilin-type N-terminal cleavage/methylation domain-containing protein